ncbi:MAG: NAD(P)H-dependent flavin oxidoreductase [Smithellaceae bacterium]
MIKTRLTELLGIKYPIILAPMTGVSEVPLVAAVCNAGGLGILACSARPAETLRQDIRKIRELVGNKPFGVNVVPHIPGYKSLIQVILEEKVPVFSHALGDPFKALGITKPQSLIFMPTVGAAIHAVKAEQQGADALLVCGWEAGGHSSYIASSVLTPLVAGRVKIPFAAGGGFSDGKGLAAALALGADGIYMGTRFTLTRESLVPDNVKQCLLQANENMAQASTNITGFHLRGIKGKKIKNYRGWKYTPWELIPAVIHLAKIQGVNFKEMLNIYQQAHKEFGTPVQFAAGAHKVLRAMEGDLDRGFLPVGQVIGRINDVPTCREIIDQTVSEAEQIIDSLKRKLS